MPRAWTRDVADSFDQALTGAHGRPPDVGLAHRQLAEYRQRLRTSGLEVVALPATSDLPDCVFIEDTAVFLGDLLVATRPGAPSRRDEVDEVVAAIGHNPTVRIEAPGTLDGGDVMVLGDRVFAGLSSRSNRSGIDQLTSFAGDRGMASTVLEVTGVLHLKSGVLPIGIDTVVVTPGTVDERLLHDLRIIHEDPAERHGFSALPLSDRVLVTASTPETNRFVAEAGFEIDPIDVSEILAADGGLTCLSIIET